MVRGRDSPPFTSASPTGFAPASPFRDRVSSVKTYPIQILWESVIGSIPKDEKTQCNVFHCNSGYGDLAFHPSCSGHGSLHPVSTKTAWSQTGPLKRTSLVDGEVGDCCVSSDYGN